MPYAAVAMPTAKLSRIAARRRSIPGGFDCSPTRPSRIDEGRPVLRTATLRSKPTC
jgi:hypothetical protein